MFIGPEAKTPEKIFSSLEPQNNQIMQSLACRIYAMHGKDVLGEIDSNGDNGSHGLPLPSELMRHCTSHRGTELPVAATARLARDGEVPFIR